PMMTSVPYGGDYSRLPSAGGPSAQNSIAPTEACKRWGVRLSATKEAFGMALLRHLLEGPGDNVLISPVSATVALGMAAAGAIGPTRDAILRTLGLDPAEDPQGELVKLAARLRDPGRAVELDLVNSLW